MLIDRLKEKQNIFSLLSFLPDYKTNAFYLVVSSFSINILALALPIMLIQIYDRIITNSSYGTLVWLAIGTTMALVIELLLRTMRTCLTSFIACQFEYSFSNSLIEKMLKSKLSNFKNFDIGVHLDRLNSVNTLKSVYGGQIFQLIMDLPFAVVYLVIVWFLGSWIVLIPILAISVYFLLVYKIKKKSEVLKVADIESEGEKSSFLIHTLKSIFTVKSMALEESMLRKYECSARKVINNTHKTNKLANIPSIAGGLVSQISTFGVIILGGFLVINGNLTIGLMSACIVIVGRAVSPFMEVASFWQRQSEIKLAISQLKEVSSMQIERVTEKEIMKSFIYGSISAENISYKIDDSDKYLFRNLTFKAEKKSFIAISGLRGSGFSTLSKILLGKLIPQEGAIFIDGFKSTEWNLSTINDQARYLSKGFIFNASVIDNLTVFRPSNNIIAHEVATMLELDTLVGSLPNGYETMLNSQSEDILPNGFIQRLSLARCLVTRPRILILDEVMNSLDAESERIFIWILGKLKRQMTIVAFTNNSKLIELSEKRYTLENGAIKESSELKMS